MYKRDGEVDVDGYLSSINLWCVLLAQKCMLYAITLEYCRHIRCYIILLSRCTKTEVCYCLEREELAAVMIAFIVLLKETPNKGYPSTYLKKLS